AVGGVGLVVDLDLDRRVRRLEVADEAIEDALPLRMVRPHRDLRRRGSRATRERRPGSGETAERRGGDDAAARSQRLGAAERPFLERVAGHTELLLLGLSTFGVRLD